MNFCRIFLLLHDCTCNILLTYSNLLNVTFLLLYNKYLSSLNKTYLKRNVDIRFVYQQITH